MVRRSKQIGDDADFAVLVEAMIASRDTRVGVGELL
jgi:hypothetical protein